MIVARPEYRPNPSRAIFICSSIDETNYADKVPEILRLLHEGREPITVYIADSPGGKPHYFNQLLSLLRSVGQEEEPPCAIITVVTHRAASAAAALLAYGDYAIAHPESIVHYHGLRLKIEDVTEEVASGVAQVLRVLNDGFAMQLAEKIASRFVFRYVNMKDDFTKLRADKTEFAECTDIEAFIKLLPSKLSIKARETFARAVSRYERYKSLLATVAEDEATSDETVHILKREGKHLKKIIDWEVDQQMNKQMNTPWSLRSEGLIEIAKDFSILYEYLENHTDPWYERFYKRSARWALPKSVNDEIESEPNDEKRKALLHEKVGPILRPLWPFHVAFCHAVLEGENELTATDAYWLGLVDEVHGDLSLRTTRQVLEFVEDPPA